MSPLPPGQALPRPVSLQEVERNPVGPLVPGGAEVHTCPSPTLLEYCRSEQGLGPAYLLRNRLGALSGGSPPPPSEKKKLLQVGK